MDDSCERREEKRYESKTERGRERETSRTGRQDGVIHSLLFSELLAIGVLEEGQHDGTAL